MTVNDHAGKSKTSSVHQPSKDRPDRTNTTKEKKIGHRRINPEGQISYKKVETNKLMGSIQLGIQFSAGCQASQPHRDILIPDFYIIESTAFPKLGGLTTPGHSFNAFTFSAFAPLVFRHFRDLFRVPPDEFLVSLCDEPMRELSNPGASGSIFYLTQDDKFILKTVMSREADFLKKLLPGYYMNIKQNPRTLLPKFFGMYCYQSNLEKNIRLMVMNNILPSSVKMHLKFDLKGSTYKKRRACKEERSKKSPTFKDLDFMDKLGEGLFLDSDTYEALMTTMRRDILVLESFKIMDYSLLLGIHNVDKAGGHQQADISSEDDNHILDATGGVPARTAKGERVVLYVGIIDVLQPYYARKKIEHLFRGVVDDADTVSVHNPKFYAHRFLKFMTDKVFKCEPVTITRL